MALEKIQAEIMRAEIRRNILQSAVDLNDSVKLNQAVREDAQVTQVTQAVGGKGKASHRPLSLTEIQGLVAKSPETIEGVFAHKDNETIFPIDNQSYQIRAGRIEAITSQPLPDATTKKTYQAVLDAKGIKLNHMQQIAFAAMISRCRIIAGEALTRRVEVAAQLGETPSVFMQMQNKFDEDYPSDRTYGDASKEEMNERERRGNELIALQEITKTAVPDELTEVIYSVIESLPPEVQIFQKDSCEFTPQFIAALDKQLDQSQEQEAQLHASLAREEAAAAAAAAERARVAAKSAEFNAKKSALLRSGKLKTGSGIVLEIIGLALAVITVLIAANVIVVAQIAFVAVVAVLSVVAFVSMVAGAFQIYRGAQQYKQGSALAVENDLVVEGMSATTKVTATGTYSLLPHPPDAFQSAIPDAGLKEKRDFDGSPQTKVAEREPLLNSESAVEVQMPRSSSTVQAWMEAGKEPTLETKAEDKQLPEVDFRSSSFGG